MKEFDKGSTVPGPGEIISELAAGLRIEVLEGRISCLKAQEYFNRKQRELNLWALANPDCPWEIGSTQVRELRGREKALQELGKITCRGAGN